MDIQNTVNGQSLAQRSALPVQSSPPERTGQVNAEQVETNKNDSRQSNARLNAADFQNEGGLSRNSPQGLREQADTQVREVTEDAVRQAISDVESFLKVQNRDLAFSIDEDTARSVVTVIDGQINIRGGSGWSYGTGSRVLVLMDGLPMLDAATASSSLSFPMHLMCRQK